MPGIDQTVTPLDEPCQMSDLPMVFGALGYELCSVYDFYLTLEPEPMISSSVSTLKNNFYIALDAEE